MLNLEARECEVQAQIQSLKHTKWWTKVQESLDFTSGEQSDLVERIKRNVLTHQSIYMNTVLFH